MKRKGRRRRRRRGRDKVVERDGGEEPGGGGAAPPPKRLLKMKGFRERGARGLHPASQDHSQHQGPISVPNKQSSSIAGLHRITEQQQNRRYNKQDDSSRGIAAQRAKNICDYQNSSSQHKRNNSIDGNKEMVAFGFMNLVGSFTSCYLTTGLFLKTAVNFNTGCKIAMADVVMAACMLLTLLFLAPLFSYTSQVRLALLRVLLYVARPTICKLGSIPNSSLYRDIEQYPKANGILVILALQLGSPIHLSNCTYIQER
ncbi:hypothetical protein RHMOL_Rhmol09G0123900 [Rhododendron molle]|uniref:Uncharacterized protein n=1 Tax=Rhododendron molle TaxID=49168 RepID=A0ACC0MCA6_RHOML|nr:hypothetical protein RHMOL_Rhmol09G0123900 [Rhododendron molle]